MTPLARRVARAIDGAVGLTRVPLIGAGDRVAVAVSGGADSVALAWLLHELVGDAAWDLVGVIHVNHGLRGAASDADEAFCRALAGRLSLAFDSVAVDVAARARERGCSLEVAARDLRYRAFEAAGRRLEATLVATGHTLDDQAETVLLRLLRGAGTRGLSAIRPRRDGYIRPLLTVRRDALRHHLEALNEPFRDDESNASVDIPRNRIRHELVPVIERMAPGGVRALARSAALAGEDEAFFQAAVIESAGFVVLSTGDTGDRPGTRIDAGALAATPIAVARRLVRDLVESVSGRSCTALHIEAVLELAFADKPSGHLDLPGLAVDRAGTELELRPARADGADRTIGVGPFERPLEVPGSVDVPEAGVRIVASLSGSGTDTRPFDPDTAVVRAGSVSLPLAVRNRRPGDRVRPLGALGRRKLQDVFVDRKVPRAERDRVPLVVDATGRVVWVAGLVLADECRVTAAAEGVIILELRR